MAVGITISDGMQPKSDETRLIGGRFRITGVLRSRRDAETLLGRDLESHAEVIVKTSPAAPGVERRAAESLALTAGAACVATPLAAGRDGARVFIARPFVVGETLEARLRKGALSVREAVEVGRGILAALERAHASGILHGRIKP